MTADCRAGTEEIDDVAHAFHTISGCLGTVIETIERSNDEVCGQMYRALERTQRQAEFVKVAIRALRPGAA